MPQPTLETDRLILRPFTLADGPVVRRLAGEREIAATTLLIPHPYPQGAAEEWIGTHAEAYAKGESVTFAITRREDGALLGAIGLGIDSEHERAEMGYWIGKPYWNGGFCTEAAAAVLEYAFNALNLNRVFAHHFSSNPSSGRVMEKIGMRYEGECAQHFRKWGEFQDIRLYGILKSDYDARHSC
jgi:RimJ/RimL family protein N-acetyltransferase